MLHDMSICYLMVLFERVRVGFEWCDVGFERREREVDSRQLKGKAEEKMAAVRCCQDGLIEERFPARADAFAGSEREEKASARSVRNDRSGLGDINGFCVKG